MTSPLPLMRVPAVPELLVLDGDPDIVSDAVSGWAESGLVVRVVRGRKMRTLAGLFDEFAAALQFPWYFGENADAFDECITDLAWLPPQSGYVVVLSEPEQVLAEEDASALAWFTASLAHASEEWSQPVEQGEWWDRPAVPFHVVLQPSPGSVEAVAELWAAAGAALQPFAE